MPPPGQDVGRTFDAIDRNRDGVISPPEFHNYYGDTSPSPQPGLGSSAGGAAPLPPALADPARHLDPPTAPLVSSLGVLACLTRLFGLAASRTSSVRSSSP